MSAGPPCPFDTIPILPLSVRIVVEIVCVLSMIGSFIIIISYICYKEHRTTARYILVHLSLSNFAQVVANFFGEVADFDHFFGGNVTSFSYNILKGNKTVMEYLCIGQAFVTMYFSISGMLWTIILAVHLYLVILNQAYFTRYLVWSSYFICYAIPLLVVVWLLWTNRLGYAPYNAPGYCGIISKRPNQKYEKKCNTLSNIYGEVFGYDLWVLLTIFLTLLLYLSALFYLRQQHKAAISDSDNFWKIVQHIDYKFIAIPMAFALVRVWSVILSFLLFTDIEVDGNRNWKILLTLTGIGNCAQGFVDAIIFIAFTPTIRNKILFVFCVKKNPRNSLTKPSFLQPGSIRIYNSSMRNYRPRQYSSNPSSPIHIETTRISCSPETSTSFQESPTLSQSQYSIQNDCTNALYSNKF